MLNSEYIMFVLIKCKFPFAPFASSFLPRYTLTRGLCISRQRRFLSALHCAHPLSPSEWLRIAPRCVPRMSSALSARSRWLFGHRVPGSMWTVKPCTFPQCNSSISDVLSPPPQHSKYTPLHQKHCTRLRGAGWGRACLVWWWWWCLRSVLQVSWPMWGSVS